MIRSIPALVLSLSAASLPCASVRADPPAPRPVAPDESARTSAAVVVDGAWPLAHTAQVLPLDARGKVVAPGRAEAQCEAVLDGLEAALREAGARLDELVKLNVYAARPDALPAFRAAFAKRMSGKARPAIAEVVGALARPEALVAADAVAVAPGVVAGPKPGGRVAVLPVGPRVYVSGQANPDPDMAQATRKTLAELAATLAHLGLDKSRVVQVKAFLGPMTAVADAEREMVAFFGEGAAPPRVYVEWKMGTPIEIELIAGGGRREGGEAVSYLTPPALKPSPVFSRVARVDRGDLIYLSGMSGPAGSSGREQVEAIFESMRKVLGDAGGDFRHLVKATYYVTDDEASKALNDLRPRYYDPKRPPAASKAPVAGVGAAGRSVSVDMIAVPAGDAGRGGGDE